jgi:glycosyltransferase involved in cell wall biosynthesis
MKRLSVIIPLYNRAAFIGQALKSLLDQRDACDLSIIVVNDGSTDDGPEIVERLMVTHPTISMISTPNQGVTKARNVGLAAVPAEAEFFSFLDSDDISPPGRFAADLLEFERTPDAQFTYGRMTLTDQLGEDGEPTPGARTVTVRGVSLSAGLYRRSLIDSVGNFDESLEQSEDTDYLLRLFESGVNHVLTPTICVYYRRHEGSMTANSKVAMRNFMLAIKKSLARRKANPTVAMPENLFDFKALIEMRNG